LEEKGQNTEDIWSSIFTNEGSVQHLDFLSNDEKDVFKTAFEIDQRWIIEHSGDRTPFVCQAQSVNVFLPADVHKADLHRIHWEAWQKGCKSLYYCRSKSIQRAESNASWKRASDAEDKQGEDEQGALGDGSGGSMYEECLSCQ
jgi:ribonucleoside-diphosphate reductase alpha chain